MYKDPKIEVELDRGQIAPPFGGGQVAPSFEWGDYLPPEPTDPVPADNDSIWGHSTNW